VTARGDVAVTRRVRLPGLRDDTVYEVTRLGPEPAWGSMSAGWAGAADPQLHVHGAVLGRVGLGLPTLRPESAVVLGLVSSAARGNSWQ